MKANFELVGLEKMLDSMTESNNKVIRGAETAMEASMAEAEAYGKRNAPWKDRTGNARNSIGGYAPVWEGNTLIGIMSIGMSYGVFLELCNGGKYRIVWPTLEWEATRLPLWLSKFI